MQVKLYTRIYICYNYIGRYDMEECSVRGGALMTEKEMLKLSVEEFSRLQGYMILSDRDSESYKAMKIRYIELKVILTASGINLTELDRIKE